MRIPGQLYKLCVSLILAFAIGVSCRLAGIPVPAPTAMVGALLVLALTTGYVAMDLLLGRRGRTS